MLKFDQRKTQKRLNYVLLSRIRPKMKVEKTIKAAAGSSLSSLLRGGCRKGANLMF